MPFSIVPSHAVPVAAVPVNEAPAVLRTNRNPQTANPPFPVLLSDSITVASGGSNAFKSENFTNNFGRPIELRTLRVFVQIPVSAIVAFQNFKAGGLIALEIEIDGVKVTRGAVPVWMFCRSDSRSAESYLTSQSISDASYAWYFSQPVPLLPGRGMKISAAHLGVVPGSAIVSIAFAGRVSAQPIPKRIPFAVSWTSRSFGYTEAGTDSAPPNALANDTGHNLNVDRIIGRAIAYDDQAAVGHAEYLDFSDFSVQGVTSFLARFGLSQSRPILKTYTPWRTVFGQNAAVETDFILKPGDYLIADVQHLAGPGGAGSFKFSQNRGSYSIVGWREV